MRKHLCVFFSILIFDLLFFSPLFYPSSKLIVTPEFGGGDSVTVQLPYKYKLCKDIKKFSLPFWSKNMAAGYPLLAEGEIGAFNPVNIATCFLFDYKTAFNLQIVIHTVIGQIGLLLLASELGMTVFAGLFLAILFPFTPLLLMNYMQITLVYPLFYLPYMLYSVLRLLKKSSFRSFLILSFFVFLQFTVSHYQIFFISFIFLLAYLVAYLYVDRKRKDKSKILILFFIAYGVGILLAGFQLLPTLEFFRESNRSSAIYGSFAVENDQNLSFKNFLTIFSPYFFGKPQNGTLSLDMALPWEGTFFIYYLPLIFLAIFSFSRKQHSNKTIQSLFVSFFIILLLALGKNSPLYLIHSLPVFSSFRYPSRFVFILIFILTVFSAFGLDFLIKKIKSISTKKILIIAVSFILLWESYSFNYNFHVLLKTDKVFLPTQLSEFLKEQGNPRIYSPLADLFYINNSFYENGYQDAESNSLHFYNLLNSTLFPQVNMIHDVSNLVSYIGPQLKRNPVLYSLISDKTEALDDQKNLKFKPSAANILKLSSVNYLVSVYKTKETYLKLKHVLKNDSRPEPLYLYEVVDSYPRIQFYQSSLLVQTLASSISFLENTKQQPLPLLIEDKNLASQYPSKALNDFISSYILLTDTDSYVKLKTSTNSDSLLVIADNYYPGWKAFIDSKETPVFRANLTFRGIQLPSGEHTVEFKYIPVSAMQGLGISAICLLGLATVVFIKRS